MTATILSISILAVIIVLFSSLGAYWQELSDGYSHAASLRATSILVALLAGNAAVDYAVNVAKFF
jgi:hypothetical protein